MNIITVIPIYRNKFQKPILFFTQENFEIGAIILIPCPQTTKLEKPALIIEINNTKNKKQFLRTTVSPIYKTTNPYQFIFLSPKIIEDIKLKTLKINKSLEFSLEKLFTKKIEKEFNKITEFSDKSLINNYLNKITSDFISKKLRPFLKKNKNPKIKNKGAQSISSFLKKERVSKGTLHSEKHYLVSEIREYFNETTKKGVGSFSFYLGFFKKIPENIIYQYWSEVKEIRKPIKDQQKIFWWKIGQYLKKKK